MLEQQAVGTNGNEAEAAVLLRMQDEVAAGPSIPGDGNNSAAVAAAVRCLYASHALARVAWRTWEFAVALILMQLHPTSLLLVSMYGLADNLVRLLLGAQVGALVDSMPRLSAAIACYCFQNACIATSACSAALLLWLRDAHSELLTPQIYWPLLVTTMVAGASSSVGSLGAAVAVERQWPPLLCGGDTAALARINSGMRAIDLSCQMLAPVAAGVLMSSAGLLPAVLLLGVYTGAAWVPEALLLRSAAATAPTLLRPTQRPERQPQTRAAALSPPPVVVVRPGPSTPPSVRRGVLAKALGMASWAAYVRQPCATAAAALALLYLTVLSLGFLMTAFLSWAGLAEATLSLFRAAGALSGLAATVVFVPLRQRLGLVGAGAAGITWQLAALTAGTVPLIASAALQQQPRLFAGSSGSSNGGLTPPLPKGLLYGLLSGLAASRLGLWLFDLAVLQLQQEMVPQSEMGAVGGVQASLQSAFEVASFIAGCIIHQPEQFWLLISGSLASVATAAALYCAFVCSGAAQSPASPGARPDATEPLLQQLPDDADGVHWASDGGPGPPAALHWTHADMADGGACRSSQTR